MQWKKDIFYGDWFSLTIFIYKRYATEKHTIVLALASWFTACNFWPWKVNFKIWPHIRPGQGQVMSQVSQYAYQSKRIDEQSRWAPFARLYLHPVASYWRIVDCDLMWPHMTSRDPLISCTQISTVGVSGHDPESFGWFRLVLVKRGAFSYYSIGL